MYTKDNEKKPDRHEIPEFVVTPIGLIHSPYTTSNRAPRQGALSSELMTIEIFPEFEAGLGPMEDTKYIYVLYWMDMADRTQLCAQRSDWDTPRPVFTIRSPDRPNPIAISIACLLSATGRMLNVTRLDAMDGSYVLDIKPYLSSIDCIPDSQ